MQASPSTKQIPILYIDHIDKGPFGQRFLRLQDNAAEIDAEILELVKGDSPNCLSIVYNNTEADLVLESLDIVVPNRDQFDLLVKSLKELVELQKEEVQHYTPTLQLLHYHWMGMGKQVSRDRGTTPGSATHSPMRHSKAIPASV